MIIKITQTASNIKQRYDVESDNLYYSGQLGSLNCRQPITLSCKDTTIKATYSRSQWVNYIPLRRFLGVSTLTRGFTLYENDLRYGHFVFSTQGYMKSFYTIALDSGEILHCYYRYVGDFNCVSIYQGDKQIALVETYLTVRDCKYTHKLYLLDDHENLAKTLSLFVLYYANYTFVRRMHMSKGIYKEKAWSYSKYNDKYDSTWRETHFPHENFFGSIQN